MRLDLFYVALHPDRLQCDIFCRRFATMANEKNRSVHILAESAIMIALATVLSMIKVYEAP